MEFLSSLVGPRRIRPHLEEGRTAGAHPRKKETEDPAKSRISNRQLSVDFRTLLKVDEANPYGRRTIGVKNLNPHRLVGLPSRRLKLILLHKTSPPDAASPFQ